MEIVVGAKRGNPIILHFILSRPSKLSLLYPVCNSAVKLGECSALETGGMFCFGNWGCRKLLFFYKFEVCLIMSVFYLHCRKGRGARWRSG
jgi:hypothetical protein